MWVAEIPVRIRELIRRPTCHWSRTESSKADWISNRYNMRQCTGSPPPGWVLLKCLVPPPRRWESKGYSAARLGGACADTTTHLGSPTCLNTWHGVPLGNVGLTVGSRPSLRSPGGSSLLTHRGYCALSCAGHVVRTWKVSSPVKLACPLICFLFFKKNYSVEQFACFCL